MCFHGGRAATIFRSAGGRSQPVSSNGLALAARRPDFIGVATMARRWFNWIAEHRGRALRTARRAPRRPQSSRSRAAKLEGPDRERRQPDPNLSRRTVCRPRRWPNLAAGRSSRKPAASWQGRSAGDRLRGAALHAAANSTPTNDVSLAPRQAKDCLYPKRLDAGKAFDGFAAARQSLAGVLAVHLRAAAFMAGDSGGKSAIDGRGAWPDAEIVVVHSQLIASGSSASLPIPELTAEPRPHERLGQLTVCSESRLAGRLRPG